jgi:RNA polymerase sigma factor (sigma-70 family)
MKSNLQFSDHELISCIKANTSLNQAIGFLYRQHFDALSALIIHNSGTAEDAKDMVQEVIVSFIDTVRNDKYRGESSVKTFLFAMTRYTWLNELKRRGRSDKREKLFEADRTGESSEMEITMEKREARKQLVAVFEKLGTSCKKILTLFYYENLSIKEILEQTTYENEQVVRNKKHKCLKGLASLVKNNVSIIENLKEA